MICIPASLKGVRKYEDYGFIVFRMPDTRGDGVMARYDTVAVGRAACPKGSESCEAFFECFAC